ncbi:hypothetical protein MJH12_18010, partial [bacterium]|nr:hypothetical protein [bacterium]
MLLGCGAGTSDSSFPTQVRITPTNGTISGILKLPTVADGVAQSKSKIHRAVSNVSDFSKFTIIAKYTENGQVQQISGIVLSGGAYEILGVPFGKEVVVEAVLGKIILKSVVSALSTENVFADRNIDLRTTAQSVLYEEIKAHAVTNSLPVIEFDNLRRSETFIRNVESLASVLEVQVQDENFSDNTASILESSTVVNEVNAVVQSTANSTSFNHLPYLQISQISTNQRGRVSIDFRVFDQEGDLSKVEFYFSTDNGVSFNPGSQSQDNFINLNSLAISSDDINSTNFDYNFFWESVADLQVGSSHDVIIKFAVYDSFKTSPSIQEQNIIQSVAFIVDNRGLPAITSLSLDEYAMGTNVVETLVIGGSNFTQVQGGSNITKVALEYFGTNTAVSPRKYVFNLGEFNVASDNQITVALPSIGSTLSKELLFPVEYRVSVTALEETLKSLSAPNETIKVTETEKADFSDTLQPFLPSSGKTDQDLVIQITGKHLAGVYDGDVILKVAGNPAIDIPLTQIDVKMSDSNPSLMEWRGQLTSPVQTGVYQLYVRNSCVSGNCFSPTVINTPTFTITEDAPIITGVSVQSQTVFNNTTSSIK